MDGKDDDVHCEDWFFCTKTIPADEIESAIRSKGK
jgi:peroxiredoxin (alkyl hydroperoxide reductase subunit C)